MSGEVFNDTERAEIEAVKEAVKQKLRELLIDLPNETYTYFKESILTGGVFASLFHGETPNDWDVYLIDQDAGAKFKHHVLRNDWNIQELILEPATTYRNVLVEGRMVTELAILFKNRLQVITYQGKAGREKFDFIHCMPYFDMKTQQLYISRAQYDAIKNRKLIQNPKHTEQPTLKRLQKYHVRGWSV